MRITTFLSVFLSLLVSTASHAETIPGYDVLGLAKYCETFLRAPRLPAFSTLLSTFGDPLPCTERAIVEGGIRLVQIDLIDATCWRNKSCPAGVPRPNDTKVIKARSASVSRIAEKYPNVEFWVSPALEHDEKRQEVVKGMLEAAQAGCPKCKVINSPFSGAVVPGYPVERHGTKVSAFSVSGDGASSFDGDNIASDGNKFEHRTSGSYSTFVWFNEMNLRCTGEDKAPPVASRTARPTSDQFRQAAAIMAPEGPKPAAPGICRKVIPLTKGEIYKPNAEAYCNGQPGSGDLRGNKPLLILTKNGRRGDRLSVVSSAGKKVGCFQYYGPYSVRGYHRWYMGDCSGQKPFELMTALGNEWGFVHMGGGTCLQINSVRRLGSYR